MKRIYLSPPDIGKTEFTYVQEAFQSNWVAPVSPILMLLKKSFVRR
jgi:dTDP-4-amino-4,6-dideoxygalactose transaminase